MSDWPSLWRLVLAALELAVGLLGLVFLFVVASWAGRCIARGDVDIIEPDRDSLVNLETSRPAHHE